MAKGMDLLGPGFSMVGGSLKCSWAVKGLVMSRPQAHSCKVLFSLLGFSLRRGNKT